MAWSNMENAITLDFMESLKDFSLKIGHLTYLNENMKIYDQKRSRTLPDLC